MAAETILVSDISGEREAITTTVGFDSRWYEVDLTEFEREELEQLLRRYISAGRTARAKPSARIEPITTAEERVQIRAWAKEQGHDLAERGRIPRSIFTAYKAAHSSTSLVRTGEV